MPAPTDRFGAVGPRERIPALVAALAVQGAVGLALLSGFSVEISRGRDVVERLIDIRLPPPPPPPRAPPPKPKPARAKPAAAPPPRIAKPGGSPGPKPHGHAVIARIAVAAASPAGGGAGSGVSSGSGAGGGTGGEGAGDDGGTDLVQIAGAILPSDYPRSLGNAGIGGRVSVTFTVETNGRVTGCRVTRSSGVPELDALTCRLMEERFRFRPSTDRYGRPIRDEVDWDHDWVAARP